MSALLKSLDRLGTLVVKDIKRRYTQRNRNGHECQLSVGEDEKDIGAKMIMAINHRQSSRAVLIPTMMGGQMMLVPRPEHGGGVDWPTSIPAKE